VKSQSLKQICLMLAQAKRSRSGDKVPSLKLDFPRLSENSNRGYNESLRVSPEWVFLLGWKFSPERPKESSLLFSLRLEDSRLGENRSFSPAPSCNINIHPENTYIILLHHHNHHPSTWTRKQNQNKQNI